MASSPRQLLGPFYTILRFSPFNLSAAATDSNNNNRSFRLFRLFLGIFACVITFIRVAVALYDSDKQPLSAQWAKLNIMLFACVYATSASIVLCLWTRQGFFDEFCSDLEKIQKFRVHPVNCNASQNRKCHITALILSAIFALVWIATFIVDLIDYISEINNGNGVFIETLYKFILNPVVYPLCAISAPLITVIFVLINKAVNSELEDFNNDLKDAVKNRGLLINNTESLATFNDRHQNLVEFVLKTNQQLIKPLRFGPIACALLSANAVFYASAFTDEVPKRDLSVYFLWLPISLVVGCLNLAPPGITQTLLREVKTILLSGDVQQDKNNEAYCIYKQMLRRCEMETRLTTCGAAYIDSLYVAKVFWIAPNVGSLMTIVKKLIFPQH